jgi:hypothetical protein
MGRDRNGTRAGGVSPRWGLPDVGRGLGDPRPALRSDLGYRISPFQGLGLGAAGRDGKIGTGLERDKSLRDGLSHVKRPRDKRLRRGMVGRDNLARPGAVKRSNGILAQILRTTT